MPVMVLACLVVLPMWGLRQVRRLGWKRGAWEWEMVPGSWWDKRAGEWIGFSLGWCVVYRGEWRASDKVEAHERVHLHQQLILGLFHWIFYALFSVVVWLACRSLHSYRANPFELDARRRCGQSTEPLGPDPDGDRFPWW